MKKIVLIPDSYKGTMSSSEICGIMEKSILLQFPQCEVISIPVADGGEGSVDCFLSAMKGKKVLTSASGPYFDELDTYYGLVENGITAVIEMAACAGLPLVEHNKNPMKTTTYGVGQLIEKAAEKGCKKIVLGLGGSCTNDGGCGAAAALGVKFFDNDGKQFIPTGGSLKDINTIDVSAVKPFLKDIKISTMCDIDNPMFGKNGAAYVFSPQKGADAKMVEELDDGLRKLAQVIKRDLGVDVVNIPGAGAAGAMGAGMVAFFGAKLEMGIQAVLDTVGFEKLISGADVIFTGEGKLDTQSLRGKVVIGIAKRAKAFNIPVIAVVGDVEDNITQAYEDGVSAIFSINKAAVPFEVAKLTCKDDLAFTMDNLLKFAAIAGCNK